MVGAEPTCSPALGSEKYIATVRTVFDRHESGFLGRFRGAAYPGHVAMIRATARAALVVAALGMFVKPTAAEPPLQVDLARMRMGPDGASAPDTTGTRRALTLDPELQAKSLKLLARANPVAGAIVAVDARSGRVLVWADRSHDGAPRGRALVTAAPAASLFKVVTTTALLERGGVHPQMKVCIMGGEHEIDRSHLDPPRGGKALCSSFGQALGHSRNAVYAQLATSYLMRNDLIETAAQLGFNHRIPFDTEVAFGSLEVPYNDLAFARTAAGFENSSLTPVGALCLAYAVATGGRAVRLRIVESDDATQPARPEYLGRVMEPSTAANLRWMMEVTVHSGTSMDAFSTDKGRAYLGGIRVAGKTGTLRPHASDPTTSWFIGFAPSRDPRIVVSVLLQNGKVWRRKANEVARDLLRVYFARGGARGVTDPFDVEREQQQER